MEVGKIKRCEYCGKETYHRVEEFVTIPILSDSYKANIPEDRALDKSRWVESRYWVGS